MSDDVSSGPQEQRVVDVERLGKHWPEGGQHRQRQNESRPGQNPGQRVTGSDPRERRDHEKEVRRERRLVVSTVIRPETTQQVCRQAKPKSRMALEARDAREQDTNVAIVLGPS